MLQQLLNLGLLPIGSDDSRFTRMEAASEGLGAALKKEPSLLIPATLIAIDNDAPEDEPAFAAAEKFVVDQWKTLRNTHTDRPRELLRSIIIQSLEHAAQNTPEIAAVVWQTAISPFNHGQAKLGQEGDLVKDFLSRVGEVAEREAIARARMAGFPPQTRGAKKTGEKAEFQLPSYAEITNDDLIMDIASAAGPQYPQGTALPNPNPYWPNSPDHWAYQFSPRMASALVKAVNLGVGHLSESLSLSMNQYAAHVDQRMADQFNDVQDVLAKLSGARQVTNIRLDVLWWSEAKYSPSLRCGYRELSQGVAAVAMAYDLLQLVPALTPASVTYVLGEAAASLLLPDAQAERRPISHLLEEVAAEGAVVADFFTTTTTTGRVPLTDLVVEAARGLAPSDGDVRARAGVDPSFAVTARDFAMWLFRDMQARKLVEGLK